MKFMKISTFLYHHYLVGQSSGTQITSREQGLPYTAAQGESVRVTFAQESFDDFLPKKVKGREQGVESSPNLL